MALSIVVLSTIQMHEYKKLSIITPVYNEERTLWRLISAIEAIDLPLSKEVILVDDGSTDGTRDFENIG